MSDVRSSTDIEFAVVDGARLALDLHRPDADASVPVVLYLHGGAWKVGDKGVDAEDRLVALARHGIAVASATYRFVDPTYPAQLRDAKAAVRWPRGRARSTGYEPSGSGSEARRRAPTWPAWALTASDPELEGTVGDHLGRSSAVLTLRPRIDDERHLDDHYRAAGFRPVRSRPGGWAAADRLSRRRSDVVGGLDADDQVGSVVVPTGKPGLDWERELVAVVGVPLRDVDEQETLVGVFGYAPFNDMTARRAQRRTTQWTLGKNVDGSGILGPITPAAELGDPADGWSIRARVNDEVMQDATTADLISPVEAILASISTVFELRPGDLLATGTPNGVGYARPDLPAAQRSRQRRDRASRRRARTRPGAPA